MKDKEKAPLTIMDKLKRAVIIITVFALIITMIRISNAPSSADAVSKQNVEATPTAQQPQGQKFDVRLSGSNSTTLEEYYYGKADGTKAVVTFNGSDKSGGKVEVMYEWNMSTGIGTWKAEHHPTRGFGQRNGGKLEVRSDEVSASFAITLFDKEGKQHESGNIIPL